VAHELGRGQLRCFANPRIPGDRGTAPYSTRPPPTRMHPLHRRSATRSLDVPFSRSCPGGPVRRTARRQQHPAPFEAAARGSALPNFQERSSSKGLRSNQLVEVLDAYAPPPRPFMRFMPARCVSPAAASVLEIAKRHLERLAGRSCDNPREFHLAVTESVHTGSTGIISRLPCDAPTIAWVRPPGRRQLSSRNRSSAFLALLTSDPLLPVANGSFRVSDQNNRVLRTSGCCAIEADDGLTFQAASIRSPRRFRQVWEPLEQPRQIGVGFDAVALAVSTREYRLALATAPWTVSLKSQLCDRARTADRVLHSVIVPAALRRERGTRSASATDPSV